MTTLHRLSRNATQPAVGREIEAACSHCTMTLTHTILAMVGLEVVKVKCRTCGGEHKYKSAREAAAPKEVKEKKARAAKAATTRGTGSARKVAEAEGNSRAVRQLYQRAMADRNRTDAVAYIATLDARPGMLVDHKSFGFGIVDAIFEGKSRFLFEDGYKILVTNR